MKRFEELSDHELYKKAMNAMLTEMQVNREIPSNHRLFDICQERNPKILETASSDADRTYWMMRDYAFWRKNGIDDHSYISKVQRIDFCTPDELLDVIQEMQPKLPRPRNAQEFASRCALPEGYFAAEVMGKSMRDANLETGDAIFIEESRTAPDGTMVMVQVEGKLLVKRIYYRDMIELHSDNSDYGVMRLDETHDYWMWGRVAYALKEIR